MKSTLREAAQSLRQRVMPAAMTALFLVSNLATAHAKVRIVASIPDLASIASTVGGDQVEVTSIARANLDVHRVEILPSYMVRVSRARLYLKVGMGLDQWADQIIDGSHSSGVRTVDCSAAIDPLEKPTGRVDARMGDIHPSGNPHYWLDPHNGGIVARTIADALAQADPAHAADFRSRAQEFAAQCEATRNRGREAIASLAVRQVLTYHKSWSYLADAFGFEVAGNIEPVPGIPPTGKHLQELVSVIQEHRVPLLLQEPYFSNDAGEFLKRQTGISVVKISPSCADEKPGSYLAHFDALIQVLSGSGKAG